MRGRSPYWILCSIAAAVLLAAASPAARADTAVDLELVLAVDISGSVDEVEAALQREGYAAAIVHPAVLDAIRSGFLRRIAVAYIEWADHFQQAVVVPWRVIEDEATAHAFAERLAAAPYGRGRYTSISAAIEFAAPMFEGNGIEGTRRVIDVSGDGPNNSGRLAPDARDAAVAKGITVNGLPIVNQRMNRFGPPMPGLDLYYRDCVIGGPGAFIVVAEDFASFAVAVRRKLVLEIAGLAPPPRPILRRTSEGKAPPCDAGEIRLRRRLWDRY